MHDFDEGSAVSQEAICRIREEIGTRHLKKELERWSKEELQQCKGVLRSSVRTLITQLAHGQLGQHGKPNPLADCGFLQEAFLEKPGRRAAVIAIIEVIKEAAITHNEHVANAAVSEIREVIARVLTDKGELSKTQARKPEHAAAHAYA